MAGNTWDTVVGGCCSAAANEVHEEDSLPQGNISCFDLEMCSEVIEDSAIGQNTYDFLLVFYSNLDRISYCLCATVDFMLK